MVLRTPQPIERRPLVLEEAPDQTPGPGQIAIAVRACAICRTDLQLAEGDLAARRVPIVPGHQIVGEVTALGPGASRWTIGDTVAVGWLGSACRTPNACC